MHKVSRRLGVKRVGKEDKLISHPYNRMDREMALASRKEVETANFNIGGMGNDASGLSVSAIGASQRNNLDLLLTGIINDKQKHHLRMFFRDIYLYDAVAGSAVDMTSTLPFSEFSLTGCPDEQLQVYASSIERLSLRTLNPYIAANYLVYGEFVATAVYNKTDKAFTDMLPYDLDQCNMQYLPFTSMEPKITVTPDGDFKAFLNDDSDEMRQLKKHIPRALIENMSSGDYVLDPLTTIYMARATLDRKEPTSYFRRLLPIYLLEKTLMRGTLTEASKRQRSLLHAVCGNENWEPTIEELEAVTALLQKADLDPLGPVITTRDGIQLSEARGGGDFWKFTDIADITSGLKLRALNISESFLSGDNNYATAEMNLSVYMENLKYFRSYYTQSLFYNKLFPVIAAVNGFLDEGKRQKESHTLHHKVRDGSKYSIPRLQWHKSLESVNDTQTMEMLNILAEKGVPVPLRMYAAAGGMSLESLEEDLEKDLEQRKLFAAHMKKLEEAGRDLEEGEADFDSYDFEESSYRRALFNPMSVKPRSLTSRNFGEQSEVFSRTVTGKKKHIFNQSRENRKINEIIAKSLGNLKDPNQYKRAVRAGRRLIGPQGM